MKTFKMWQESDEVGFDAFVEKYEEIDKEMYWYFLEILPPYYVSHGFMVSEAYDYCPEFDTQTYGCFIEWGGKFYSLGNISPKAVNGEFSNLLKTLEQAA